MKDSSIEWHQPVVLFALEYLVHTLVDEILDTNPPEFLMDVVNNEYPYSVFLFWCPFGANPRVSK